MHTMFSTAFAKFEKPAELAWMDTGDMGSLRFVQDMCYLIARGNTRVACKVSFVINNEHETNSAWYAAAYHLQRAIDAFFAREWNDPLRGSQKIRHLLGCVQFILEGAPCLARMEMDMPEVLEDLVLMEGELQLALEWHVRLTTPHCEEVLEFVPARAVGIPWPAWNHMLRGQVAYHHGNYTAAYKHIRAVAKQPFLPAWATNFLATSRKEFTDVTTKAAATATVTKRRGTCPKEVAKLRFDA